MTTFATKYGRFSKDFREYVITTPSTPRPWVNVISNGDYGFTISQTGSGYSWRTHAQLNRITRWEQDLVRDEWGKYIYITDEKGELWSAGWKPVCAEPDSYSCVHGVGYSSIEQANHGVTSRLVMFVPNEDPLEVWHLTLRNTTKRPRKLNLFTYFEWGLGAAPDWHREFHKSFIETSYDPAVHGIMAAKRLWEVPTDRGHWNTEWPYVAFHASSIKPVSFETDKEAFLGMYGDLRSPSAVRKGKLGGHEGNWLDPVGSLHLRVTLKPGEERSLVFLLGAADSLEHARGLIAKYGDEHEARKSLVAVRERWDAILGTTEVATPDAAMNVMENTWLKYQTISGRLWARTAYYQTGGAYGFRDQLQDSQVFLAIEPERTLTQLRLHARHQFVDGSVYHWWHPISEIGLRNEISDNLLWLPYIMNGYLEETGNDSALELAEPFVDEKTPATLYEHCVRAIDRSLGRMSPNGLPLIGGGDWNDGLSAVGLDMKGESIWLGHFLHRILIDFAVVAGRRGDSARNGRYLSEAERLRLALNERGWDGMWYYGATKDSGERLGSASNPEGSVWLNPQTWAVISGVADSYRGNSVFDVVEKRLESEIGPLLLTPAYSVPDKHIGYLTRYSPGMRENGGVYTHGATWAVIAAAMLGRGEAAFRIYSKLNPIVRGKHPDRYMAEPYVTPGNIEGPESTYFGRGGWTWYSGSAGWLLKVGFEWILGVRATHEGLLVDPCIPGAWKDYSVKRIFRGVEYRITVHNPSKVEFGVLSCAVDGGQHVLNSGERGVLLPLFESGSVHSIDIIMGERR
jgi:cellobiose phosphorylase